MEVDSAVIAHADVDARAIVEAQANVYANAPLQASSTPLEATSPLMLCYGYEGQRSVEGFVHSHRSRPFKV